MPTQGALTRDLMWVYLDLCVFLYETKTRPSDVVRARIEDIRIENGRAFYCYVPEKKKNNKKAQVVKAPMSLEALEIAAKYNGMSSQGYIFPFSMNEYEWKRDDKESWNKWNNRKSRLLEMVNKWLKKVAVALDWNINATLYTFRRSALTHACMSGGNHMQIALDAGTSTTMLEHHYVSNTVAVTDNNDTPNVPGPVSVETLLKMIKGRTPSRKRKGGDASEQTSQAI